MLIGAVKTVPVVAVGTEPLVVKRICAPGVLVVRFTETGAVKNPRFTLKSGASTNPSTGVVELFVPGEGMAKKPVRATATGSNFVTCKSGTARKSVLPEL